MSKQSKAKEVSQNQEPPTNFVYWNEIGETWFLCNYCLRAFLHSNELLKHKRKNHRTQFYQDKGITRGTRNYKRKTRSQKEEAAKAEVQQVKAKGMKGSDTDTAEESSDGNHEEKQQSFTDEGKTDEDVSPRSSGDSNSDVTTESLDGNDSSRDISIETEDTNNKRDHTIMDTMGINETENENENENKKCSETDNKDLSRKFREAFRRQAALKYHKCGFCSSRFPTKCGLKLHEIVFHNQRKTLEFSCRFCHKLSLDESFHLIHEKTCSQQMIKSSNSPNDILPQLSFSS